MKFGKKRFIPLLALLLCSLLAIETMAAGSGNIDGFSNFTGANLFSKAAYQFTGTSTTGTATAAVVDDVPTITLKAKGYKPECGNHFSACTTTVTLRASKTIAFTCVTGGSAQLYISATKVETVDSTTKNIVVNANTDVTFSITNNTVTETSATVSIKNVREVSSKVPTDSASFTANGQTFPYLDDAIDAVKTNGGTIVVATSGTAYDSSVEDEESMAAYLEKPHSFIIPTGVTLLVPHDAINTTYYDTPTFVDCVWGSTLPSTPYSIPSDFRVLTLSDGTSLTVEGSLCVSGQPMGYGSGGDTPNGGVTGPAGRLQLNSGSTVTVKGGLYSYGFITGAGSIDVSAGAQVYEMFTFTDWRGGKISVSFNSGKKVFPFSQYYIQNIEAKMTVNAGAYLSAWTGIGYGDSGKSDVRTSKVAIIGDSASAMFKLDSGSITKTYIPATDRLQLDVSGDVSMGSIAIEDKDAGTVNSANFPLPINSNWTININSGNVTSTQKLALLPGVEFNIAKNANVNLGADVIVYDIDDWGNYCATWGQLKPINSRPGGLEYNRATGSAGSYTFKDPQDAKIKVDGTLTATTGKLYTTAAGASVYSTGEGRIVITAGTATQTQQGTTSSSAYNAKYDTITISSAKLKNGDGSNSPCSGVSGTFLYNPGSGTWVCETHTGMDDGVCNVCGYISHDTHTYGDYISNGDATLDADGTKTRWCTVTNCMEHETVTDEGSMLVPAAIIVQTGAKYLTLAEAVEAAKTGDTVQVKKNLTLDATQTIPAGKNFTLDLGEFTVTCGGTVISNKGTLSIKGNGGKLVNTASGQAAIHNTATIGAISGTVTIESAGIGIYVTGTNATVGTIGGDGSVISVSSSSSPLYLTSGARVTTIAAPGGSVSFDCTTSTTVVYLHSSHIGLIGENVFVRGTSVGIWVHDAGQGGDPSTASSIGEINAGNGKIEIINTTGYALKVSNLSSVGPVSGHVLFVGSEVSSGQWIIWGYGGSKIGPMNGGYFYRYGVSADSIAWIETPSNTSGVLTAGTYTFGPCKKISSSTIDVTASNGNTYPCYYVTEVHSATLVPGTPSSCTADGVLDYYHCGTCGGNFTDAAGKNPIADLDAWKKGDGKIPMHSFNSEGKCIVCGIFKIYASSLRAGDTLDLFFYMMQSHMPDLDTTKEGYNYRAEITRYQAGSENGKAEEPIPSSEWTTYGSDFYRFCYDGIFAKEMTDKLVITITKKVAEDTWVPVSVSVTESVEGYAYRYLSTALKDVDPNEDSKDAKLRQTLVDMLQYGAACQEYFDHNIGNLANAQIEEYITDRAETPRNNYTGDSAVFLGDNVTVENDLTYSVFLNQAYKGSTVKVSYTNHYGTPVEREYTVEYNEKQGAYGFSVPNLAIADGTAVITCQLMNGESILPTLTSSLETYCYRAITAENNLKLNKVGQMLMNFIDSAYSYFHYGESNT